jgi:hypothetical protein
MPEFLIGQDCRINHASEGTRTPDTRYRKPLLYPLSYRCRFKTNRF